MHSVKSSLPIEFTALTQTVDVQDGDNTVIQSNPSREGIDLMRFTE